MIAKKSPRPKHQRSAWHYGLAIHKPCSRCGAEAGSICRTPSGARKSSLHEERWALIADAPTNEQLAGPAPEKPPAGTSMHDRSWAEWNVAFDRWYARLRGAQSRWESLQGFGEAPQSAPIEAAEAFSTVIMHMGLDNGTRYQPTAAQRLSGEAACAELIAAGFFADDPDSLEGSFWQAAAGEMTEAEEFFAAAPEAYTKLSVALNEIFNAE